MVEAQQDWQGIDEIDLPENVQKALERDFEEVSVSEAFVKDENGEKTYKLVVIQKEGENKEIFADAEGNWLDDEK